MIVIYVQVAKLILQLDYVLEQNSDDSDESDDEIILGDEEQTGV